MGRRGLASSLLGAAVAAALVLAPSALAGGPTINEAGGPAFPERAYTLHVPREVALDPGDVTVRDGLPPRPQVQAPAGRFVDRAS